MPEFESLSKLNPKNVHFEVPRGYGISVIKLYFWVGLVSAVLLRIIIIADHYSAFYAKVAWYLAVAGYLWFFMHRYHIAKRRFSVIDDLELLKKVRNQQKLSKKDVEGLDYLLWSLSVSKERSNYLIISVFSVLSIALSLVLDMGILNI